MLNCGLIISIVIYSLVMFVFVLSKISVVFVVDIVRSEFWFNFSVIGIFGNVVN